MKYKKFRELKVDVLSIKFNNFGIKKILNYLPAGNDVVEVLTDDGKNYFIKVERSKVADFNSEYKNILKLHKIGYNLVPDVVEYISNADFKCIVLNKKKGKRLSEIINPENKGHYLYNLGKELSKIHLINASDFDKAKQRVINEIPYDNLYCKFDKVAYKYVDYLKKNNYKIKLDTFIHGDFHYANVLWYNKTVSGILDWEYSGIGHKEQDIAWALVLRPKQTFLNSIADIKIFLEGYSLNGNYDEKKLKWCLINSYLHFYLMNNDKKYRNILKQLMNDIVKSNL